LRKVLSAYELEQALMEKFSPPAVFVVDICSGKIIKMYRFAQIFQITAVKE